MREDADGRDRELDVEVIGEILEAAPVTRAILFGSHARGDEHAMSDVDVAVEFESGLSSIERTRARLSLIERLSVALGLEEIDVIPLSAAPADLRREIETDGVVLLGEGDLSPSTDDATSSVEANRERFDELLADLERVV